MGCISHRFFSYIKSNQTCFIAFIFLSWRLLFIYPSFNYMETNIPMELLPQLSLGDYKNKLKSEKPIIKKAAAVIFLSEYVFADNKKGLGVLWFKKMADAGKVFKELKKQHPVAKLALGKNQYLKDGGDGTSLCRVTILKGGLPEEKIQDKSDKWFELQKVSLEIVMAIKGNPEDENDLPADPQEEPISDTQVPAWWPEKRYIGPSSSGLDVHYLRVKVNQLLGKAVLPFEKDRSKSRFNDNDALAVKEVQKRMGLLSMGQPGIASGGTLDAIKSVDSLPDTTQQDAPPDPTIIEPANMGLALSELQKVHARKGFIGWGSKGSDVYYLRMRLNQVLYGRITPLPLPKEPKDAIFMKLDSDAVLKFQQQYDRSAKAPEKLILPGWKTRGGGAPGVVQGDTLALLADAKTNPNADFIAITNNQATILQADTKKKGAYDPEKGFADPVLQQTLDYYCKEMGLDWKKLDSKQKSQNQTGGDTGVDGINGLPAWVNAFQNRTIDSPTWGREERTLSALANAYLTEHYTRELAKEGKQLPPSISTFFDHIGQSELNGSSNELAENSAGTPDWCAYGSSSALAKGLEKMGLQVKMANPAGKRMNPALCAKLLEKMKKNTFAPDTYKRYHLIQPGDIISYVSKTSALTGHVVTVVMVKGDILHVMSGNGGSKTLGNGSVRIHEVRMIVPHDTDVYTKIQKVKDDYAKQSKEASSKRDAINIELKRCQDQIKQLEKTLATPLDDVLKKQAQEELAHFKTEESRLIGEREPVLEKIAELEQLNKSLRPQENEVDSTSNVWIFSIQEASFLNRLAIKAVAERWSDAQLAGYGLEWIKK